MTTTTFAAPQLRPASRLLDAHKRELSVAAAYAALLLLLAVVAPAFFRGQLLGTWVRAAPVLVAAAGMTLVIVARQIDISIGSQFSVCAVLAGYAAKAGVPMPLVAAAAVAAGAAMGAVNGWLVAFAGLPSIVVTLATMVVWRESLRWLQQGASIGGLPAHFQWLGASQHAGEAMLIAVGLLVAGAAAWGARNLHAGRAVYATGSDADAARLAGIRPKHVTFYTFVLLGALTGLASLLDAVRFPQIDPNSGNGLELLVIAAVVVGGTAISGGRGTLVGTLLGVVLLTTIGPALTFLHIAAQWEQAVQGAIILAAVGSEDLLRRGRRRV